MWIRKFWFAALLGLLLVQGCEAPQPLEKVTFAEPSQPLVAPVYVAEAKGYFRDEGLDVTFQATTSGRDALRAVLDGKADVSIVAETPIMHAAIKGKPISVLAIISNSEENIKVLARRDKGIAQPADLRGKTIASSFGTNGEFYKHAFLRLNRIPLSAVTFVNLNPERMVSALQKGDIDASVTWEPHITRAERLMKNRLVSFSQPGLYTFTFDLVGLRSYVDAHPQAVRKLLRALIKAATFIHSHPEEAMAITAKRLGMDMDILQALWKKFNFNITLDDYLLISMSNQAKWAVGVGYVSRDIPIPDFRSFIHLDALREIDPSAVTIRANEPHEGGGRRR